MKVQFFSFMIYFSFDITGQGIVHEEEFVAGFLYMCQGSRGEKIHQNLLSLTSFQNLDQPLGDEIPAVHTGFDRANEIEPPAVQKDTDQPTAEEIAAARTGLDQPVEEDIPPVHDDLYQPTEEQEIPAFHQDLDQRIEEEEAGAQETISL